MEQNQISKFGKKNGVWDVVWQNPALHTTAAPLPSLPQGEGGRLCTDRVSLVWGNLNINTGPDFSSGLEGATEATSLPEATMYVGGKRKEQHIFFGGRRFNPSLPIPYFCCQAT